MSTDLHNAVLTQKLKARVKDAANVLKSYLKDDTEEIISATLKIMGVDDSDIGIKILESQTTSVSDFLVALKSCVSPTGVVPEPRARVAWLILQGHDPFKTPEIQITSTQNTSSTLDVQGDMNISGNLLKNGMRFDAALVDAVLEKLEKQKPIGQWADLELLKGYGKSCPMSIEEELSKRAKNRPVIIFNEDNTVNTETSLILLRQARNNDTPSTFIVAGVLKEVYKIGDFPVNVMYECPIHSNVLLLNGYCEECGMEWKNIDDNKDKYVFLRLVSQTAKIDPVALRTYMSLSFDELVKLFPKIMLTYNALKEEERLPTLKRRLSKNKQGDPFRIVHRGF
jgi:hypothetical protein